MREGQLDPDDAVRQSRDVNGSPPTEKRDDAHDATELNANRAQRRRSAALVAVLLSLAGAGAAFDRAGWGSTPPACPAPALRDGILVCDGNGRPPGARAWLVGGKLDVNHASAREIEQIPGVGPSLARSILEARTARGRFRSFDELDEVDGIGPKTLDKLRSFLEVR